jgi:hypothetical protein
LQRVGGKDASKQFWKYHNESILNKFKPKLQIGSLDSKKSAASTSEPEPESDKKSAPAAIGEATKKGTPIKPKPEAGTVSAEPTDDFDPPLDTFGDLVPYADPNWYQSVSLGSDLKILPRAYVNDQSIIRHTTTKAMPISASKSEPG